MIPMPVSPVPANARPGAVATENPEAGQGEVFADWMQPEVMAPAPERLSSPADDVMEVIDPDGDADDVPVSPGDLALIGQVLPASDTMPAEIKAGAARLVADSVRYSLAEVVAEGPVPPAAKPAVTGTEVPAPVPVVAEGAQPAQAGAERLAAIAPAVAPPPAQPPALPVPVPAPPAMATPLAAAPPPVSRQVADALVRMEGDVTEITLAPAELGRLRITLTRDSQGLVVLLTAERPEALDLLRRHGDLLRQELAGQGEGEARLEYSAGGQDGTAGQAGRRANRGPKAGPVPDAGPMPETAATIMRPVLPGRIDMRI